MSTFRLILRNLKYYWQKNLLLLLGISISAAVLTGALIVGDSVSYSLKKIVHDRLGGVSHVIRSGDRYFTASLASAMNEQMKIPFAPVLLSEGMAIAGGGQNRIPDLMVYGVDSSFDLMSGTPDFYSGLHGDQLIISENTADRLGVEKGEEILIRIKRTSLIPMNAPFVSDQENTVSARMEITGIAGRERLGTFNLHNSQTAPFNAFMSLERLNRLMELENRANLLLVKSESPREPSELLNALAIEWELRDASFTLEKIEENNELELSSERVFMEKEILEPVQGLEGFSYPVISYFVNEISAGNRSAPYSFVSTLSEDLLERNEAIINRWLSEDIGAEAGDSLRLKYFVVGPMRELEEKEAAFFIKEVIPMNSRFSDRNLMPHLPGLSDAGNCRDWETGIPIDLEKIRDKDEDYWDEWRGTPKAFISLPRGVELWENRFGTYTALRFSADETDAKTIENEVLKLINPSHLGFTADAVRTEGEKAAAEGVDFSQLFAGLSFFLLAAAVLLTVLLFLLNLEYRKDQIRTFSSLGIPAKQIRRIILSEGVILSIIGTLTGLVLAVFYNRAVFHALNGIWQDIVRTDMLMVNITGATLLQGFAASFFIAFLAIALPLKRYLNRSPGKSRTGDDGTGNVKMRFRVYHYIFLAAGIAGIVLIAREIFIRERENASVYFISGGLLLISFISFFRAFLLKQSLRSFSDFRPSQLSMKNAIRNPARSMTIIILFALATFLVISTGSNRKDLFVNAEDPSSGTGGFLFYAESSVPVLHDLNDPEKSFEYGLGDNYSLVQFRKSQGDDASCLNLNRIQNPAIIATHPEKLRGRFSFQTRTPYLDASEPWLSLNQDLEGDLVPAIADETVIKWGLGKKVGDTLHYTDANGGDLPLLLVGGISPSIFQGKVIVSEEKFLQHFPQSSGTHIFLVDGDISDSAQIYNELSMGLRDFGIEIELSAKRLAEFNSVTNTYLSIFLVLGALGLLLGTVGLGIVLFRTLLERRNEIALMKAVGFRQKLIRRIISREYNFLLISGIGIGFITAVIATLPSILSPNTSISFITLLLLVLILVLSGWLWTFFISSLALRNRAIYGGLREE